VEIIFFNSVTCRYPVLDEIGINVPHPTQEKRIGTSVNTINACVVVVLFFFAFTYILIHFMP